MFHGYRGDGGDERDLYILLVKLMVLRRQVSFNLAVRMRISSEQVPSFHKVASRY